MKESPDGSGEEPGHGRSRVRRTSRRIHYWILVLILATVTGSFLFLDASRLGTGVNTPGRVSPRSGHLVNWAVPRKGFLSTLIHEAVAHAKARAKSRSQTRILSGRPGRRERQMGHRERGRLGGDGPSPARPFAKLDGARWTQVQITAHASPILAWPASSHVARLRARATTLQTVLAQLGSHASGEVPSGSLSGLLKHWSKHLERTRGLSQHAHDRLWLQRQNRQPLLRPELILPSPRRPTLMPGSVIPAVLESEIDSDLPGMIVARVTQAIDDSVHERQTMIPMGSTLVGYYSSDVNQGQTRVLASFNEIIFPDGRRVPLAGMAAADAYGASGLKDEVHTHFWKVFGSSFLIAALSAFLPADQSSIILTPGVSAGTLVGSAAGEALVGTSQAILARNERVPPTLVVRPGFRFLVMVNRPITLSAHSG